MRSDPISGESRYSFLRPQRRSRLPVIAVVAVLVIAGGIGLYWWRSRTEPLPPAPALPATDATPPPAVATPPPLDLPELNASDALVRDMVARLSAHPRLAAWLANDDLIRRFVATVANLAVGSSPVSHLRFLAPEQGFAVHEVGGRLFIDPASYRRYDLLTAVVVSLDTNGTARLYHQLHPLFDEAYRELGIGDGSFDDAMALAMGNLLALPVPDRSPEVVPSTEIATAYEYADGALEARSMAAKHLLRLGPDNARRVQMKLRELAGAIGIQPRTGAR